MKDPFASGALALWAQPAGSLEGEARAMSDDLEMFSFEQAFRELEVTVQRLEAGDLSLEEAIALYERGMHLARRCGAALDTAELQVQRLALADNLPGSGDL